MKKALSLLLAVLMLVSLFSGMAFADDDVIVEEPADDVIAEEPAAAAEIVGDDYVEAADAFVEEYTDEGSFEAADAYTPSEIRRLVTQNPQQPALHDWVLDRWEATDGTVLASEPTVHGTHAFAFLKEYLGEDENHNPKFGSPEKFEVIVPHNWGEWVTVPEGEASCVDGGYVHNERKCKGYPTDYAAYIADPDAYAGTFDGKCTEVEKTPSTYLPMQAHNWVQDKTYTGGDYGKDDRAIIKAPTCKADGLGNWVCSVCGAYAWDKILVKVDAQTGKPSLQGVDTWVDPTYPIVRMNNAGGIFDPNSNQDIEENQVQPKYHSYGDFTEIKPATCEVNGTKAHYCNICKFKETVDIPAYHHNLKATDPINAKTALVFDHIERVDCTHYVEVWTCSIDGCKGGLKQTAPYSEFMGPVDPQNPMSKLNAFREPLGNNKDKALDVKDLASADKCFEYSKVYYVDNNTEHYDHHRYSTEWTVAEENGVKQVATCCKEGKMQRKCTEKKFGGNEDCGFVDYKPIPALDPIYGTTMETKLYNAQTGKQDDNGTVYVHFVNCTREECVKERKADAKKGYPEFGKIESLTTKDAAYFTQANVKNPEQVMIVDHDWGDWTVYVAPTATTLGHWTRTCQYMEPVHCHEVQEFIGTQKEFDEMNSHPVLQAGLIPEIIDGVVVYKLYEMGIFQEDVTGVVECYCEGVYGKFYVKDGIWQKELNGAKLDGETWYFLANGKVCEVNQLCEYQSEWFYVKNGVIDTTMNGLVDYDGGTFMLGAGRIQKEVSGLWENSKSIGGDGEWYYLANGQVQKDYTGLVQYDGEWFYVENGKLVPFNGTVEYDGEKFEVKNGMVVA